MHLSKMGTLAGLIFLIFTAFNSAKADTLTFSNVVALEGNGSTQVDLFSNPGATLFGPRSLSW